MRIARRHKVLVNREMQKHDMRDSDFQRRGAQPVQQRKRTKDVKAVGGGLQGLGALWWRAAELGALRGGGLQSWGPPAAALL